MNLPLAFFGGVDPWIFTFSFITVAVTLWMGFRSAKSSKTASDFFVAGRSVSVGWNASAISGEYLSAASFMGVAGMVMSSGYDALWYPVCYACGYLFLLLFIAGPLRRFGAYTIPDFAEGRFDSPMFRKIAVCFVLFIGFFYTMPQMKGAGVTLAYIFLSRRIFFYGSNLCFAQSDDVPWLGNCSFVPQARIQVTKCRAPLWQVSRPHGRPRATGRPCDRGTSRNSRARLFRVAHV